MNILVDLRLLAVPSPGDTIFHEICLCCTSGQFLQVKGPKAIEYVLACDPMPCCIVSALLPTPSDQAISKGSAWRCHLHTVNFNHTCPHTSSLLCCMIAEIHPKTPWSTVCYRNAERWPTRQHVQATWADINPGGFAATTPTTQDPTALCSLNPAA